MKKYFSSAYIILTVLLGQTVTGMAQIHHTKADKIIKIPFEPSRFDTSQRKTTFMTYEGMKVM